MGASVWIAMTLLLPSKVVSLRMSAKDGLSSYASQKTLGCVYLVLRIAAELETVAVLGGGLGVRGTAHRDHPIHARASEA